MATTKQYLAMAYQAATKSPDPSTQNGAVIVTASGTAADCNRFPDRVKITDERLQRPLKYNFIEHAERNVIFQASRQQLPIMGATMYVPWAACADCARAIVQVGIKKIVRHKQMMDGTPDHWKESIAHAEAILGEAGIIIEEYDGKLDGCKILFNGSWFYP